MKNLKLTLIIFALTTLTATPVLAANVSAWLPSWDVEEATHTFTKYHHTIDTISPFWYNVNEDGTITPKENSEDREIINFAKENGTSIIPTITNSFDGNKVSPIFNDPEEKRKNIQNIINVVLKFDYDGIDIDYEGLKSEDKDAFTAYIKDLRNELNKHGKKLTIAIQAKSFPTLSKFGDRGQDWEKLHQYVDEFRIMTYDYGWRGSIPRPVAPYYWVEEVIEYAIAKVPREKIYVGIPFYGYGWSDDFFTSYTYETIKLILRKYGVDFQYDPSEKTNKLYYVSVNDTREQKLPHEVWFENHVSIQPKLDLVKEYNLGGIAIWRLGKEDTDNWREIRRILKNEPLGDRLYFKDVNQNTKYYTEITRLAFLGIVKGHGDTFEYRSFDKVNRAEILKMALNSFAKDTSKYAFEETRSEDFFNPFKDVYDGEWYFPYVQTAVDIGIIQGYPDGTFKPDQKIIRVEAIKLALESAGIQLPPTTGKWYLPYRNWAISNGLYTSDTFNAEEEITRGEAAYLIAKIIETVE